MGMMLILRMPIVPAKLCQLKIRHQSKVARASGEGVIASISHVPQRHMHRLVSWSWTQIRDQLNYASGRVAVTDDLLEAGALERGAGAAGVLVWRGQGSRPTVTRLLEFNT